MTGTTEAGIEAGIEAEIEAAIDTGTGEIGTLGITNARGVAAGAIEVRAVSGAGLRRADIAIDRGIDLTEIARRIGNEPSVICR